MTTRKIELSVGAVKYAYQNEIFTEEELNNIKNKIPELDEKVGVIDDEIKELNSSLDNIETQKATKSDLDIQKKRIDSFISLKEGSTTGDAELIDGRIGNDGIIYDSIGNAIRGQIHTINNALNTKIGLGDDLNIPINSISMEVGRILWTTGYISDNVMDFSYITLDVNGYKNIEMDTDFLGANDLGYAFYDSSNTYISGSKTKNEKVNITIPDNAYFFRYGDRNATWQTRISENKSIILINKDERTYNELNKRLINLEEYNKNQNKEYGINPNEIGVMDNKFPYVWYGVGNVYSMTSKYSKPTNSRTSFVISTDFDGQSGMIRNNGTAYFTINKGAEVKYYKLRAQNGAECTFDSTVENGKVLYQHNTNNKMGEVIYSDEDKIVVFIESYSIPMTFSCYSDTNRTIESPFDINLNKSAIFYKEYPKSQINFDYKYLSRAEKLGSKIIGKNLFVFSDSQSSVIKPLAQDFGANVFSISNGGCRMGYVTGSGLGGESGSANSLWLCNKERTDQFNDFIYNNNINIDYIINFTGGNGDFDNIGNAEELSYVLNNKRWFGDRSDNDKFDNLSDENKLRFTSPLCYIASFITLNKLFPKAISVCVDLYGSVGNTLGSGKFENGVWKNNNDVANAIYNHDVRTLNKSRLIREISELIGAILVKASECGLNVINCPTYASDSVHANFKMATNLAYNIHKKIDFFNSIEEDYK